MLALRVAHCSLLFARLFQYLFVKFLAHIEFFYANNVDVHYCLWSLCLFSLFLWCWIRKKLQCFLIKFAWCLAFNLEYWFDLIFSWRIIILIICFAYCNINVFLLDWFSYFLFGRYDFGWHEELTRLIVRLALLE